MHENGESTSLPCNIESDLYPCLIGSEDNVAKPLKSPGVLRMDKCVYNVWILTQNERLARNEGEGQTNKAEDIPRAIENRRWLNEWIEGGGGVGRTKYRGRVSK